MKVISTFQEAYNLVSKEIYFINPSTKKIDKGVVTKVDFKVTRDYDPFQKDNNKNILEYLRLTIYGKSFSHGWSISYIECFENLDEILNYMSKNVYEEFKQLNL